MDVWAICQFVCNLWASHLEGMAPWFYIGGSRITGLVALYPMQ